MKRRFEEGEGEKSRLAMDHLPLEFPQKRLDAGAESRPLALLIKWGGPRRDTALGWNGSCEWSRRQNDYSKDAISMFLLLRPRPERFVCMREEWYGRTRLEMRRKFMTPLS